MTWTDNLNKHTEGKGRLRVLNKQISLKSNITIDLDQVLIQSYMIEAF